MNDDWYARVGAVWAGAGEAADLDVVARPFSWPAPCAALAGWTNPFACSVRNYAIELALRE